MINILVLKDKAGNIVYSQSYNSDDDCVEFILPRKLLTKNDIEGLKSVVVDETLGIDSEEVSGVCPISELHDLTKLKAFELAYEFDKEGKLVEIS